MRVAVLGCGYVGLELGRQLLDRCHEVVGVRRSELDEVREVGLDAIRADVTEPDTLAAVPDADALVFAASTGGGNAAAARELYVGGLRTVAAAFGGRSDPPERLVYTSSTGVYGDHGGDWVDENTPLDPTTEKTRALVDAEGAAREAPFDATVVRFAGLYGPGRYRLQRHLDGPVTEGYLNMVHRDDAAGIVRFALDRRVDTLLAVDDEPVSKWAFADWLADACGVPRPSKQTREAALADRYPGSPAARRLRTSKRCSNSRLRDLGYEFDYPTFREGYRAAVEAHEG